MLSEFNSVVMRGGCELNGFVREKRNKEFGR